MIHKFLVGGLLAAAASLPVLAQTAPAAPPVPPPQLTPMRPMADGVVTRAEVSARVQQHFTRMDSNRDGVIAGDELARGHGDRRARMARRDGPAGKVGHGPIGHPATAFDRLDLDKNGSISREEFAQVRGQRMERRMAGGAGHKMRMRHHRGAMGAMMGGRMIRLADTNSDGRVTLQEATASALQRFDSADSNRDGRLTRDEMRAGHQRMRGMMRRPG